MIRLRPIRNLLISTMLMMASMSAMADDSIGWFNYQSCDFCKQWATQPGLIAHAKDECLNLSNGIIWMTTVEPAYRHKFEIVQAAEDSVAMALQAGKPGRLCEFCRGIGGFLDKGVHMESVPASGAWLIVFTSSDTSIVNAMHDFGAKAMAEEAKANATYLAAHNSK